MSTPSEHSVAGLDVSRETFEALEAFVALVRKWNPVINLVSKSALEHLWERHIVDSAQLVAFCPPDAKHWIDIGSGGGFPGMIVAILARETMPNLRVTLVESDQRKATFLGQAAQSLGLPVMVLNKRIESAPPFRADVVSARAVAPLDELLGLVEPQLGHDGVALFPKGAQHADEIVKARTRWRFGVATHPSLTDPAAAILEIRNISREP